MTDALDLEAVQIVGGGTPDIRAWPATASITSLTFDQNGVSVTFDKEATWPDVTPPGWTGPIRYTLWLLVNRGGVWTGGGVIEFWHGRGSSGPYTQASLADHLSQNWIHDGHWGFDYQVQTGEQVAFLVTAGDQRLKDVHAVAERSNIVVVPVQNLATHTFTPTPEPIPTPTPVPTPDLTALSQKVDHLTDLVTQLLQRPAPSYVGNTTLPWLGAVTVVLKPQG